jgi:hypothetical protein
LGAVIGVFFWRRRRNSNLRGAQAAWTGGSPGSHAVLPTSSTGLGRGAYGNGEVGKSGLIVFSSGGIQKPEIAGRENEASREFNGRVCVCFKCFFFFFFYCLSLS